MSPVCRVLATRSSIRLIVRTNVDLPQPDGPIRAMTERSGTSNEMSNSACFSPYQNDRLRAASLMRPPCSVDGWRPLKLRSDMIAVYDDAFIRTFSRTRSVQRTDLAHAALLALM